MENENDIKIKVGARIKYLRNEIGLTQEQLANQLPNVKGKSSIANYENGSNFPSDEVKLKLCEIFNCTLDYLMCKSDIRNPQSSFNDDELHFALSQEDKGYISDEVKNKIREYAKFVIEQEKNKKDK